MSLLRSSLLLALLAFALPACDSAGPDAAPTDPAQLGAGVETAEIVQANASGFIPSSTAILGVNRSLQVGQKIQAQIYRKAELVMQSDGNLVLYSGIKGGPANNPLWSTQTGGKRVGGLLASQAVMQADGNLVLYTRAGKAVWNSGTWNRPQSRLRLEVFGFSGVRLDIVGPGGGKVRGLHYTPDR